MKLLNLKISLILFIVLWVNIVYAQEKESSKRTSAFNENWLNAIISIETKDKENKVYPRGTGFLVKTEKEEIVLVTASHVVKDKQNLTGHQTHFNNTKISWIYVLRLIGGTEKTQALKQTLINIKVFQNGNPLLLVFL